MDVYLYRLLMDYVVPRTVLSLLGGFHSRLGGEAACCCGGKTYLLYMLGGLGGLVHCQTE